MLKSVVSLSVALALTACSPQNTQPESQAPTAVTQQKELTSGVNKENMDLTADPGNDFFQYVNGTWVDNLEIPADKSSYGAFTILRDESQDHVMKIIKSSAEGDFADGTDEQKVGDFYRAYMDTDTLNELGISPINADIEKIEAITNYDELAAYFAYAIRYGYVTPFNVGQNADFKSPESYMIYTWQSGLGLPERDYYFKDDAKSQEIRDAYVKHIETMFTLAEFDAPSDNAQMLFDMESRIAELHMKKEEVRNWAANYNKVPVSDLSTLMPNFPWSLFLNEMELNDVDSLVFLQTDFMKQMDTFIAETS